MKRKCLKRAKQLQSIFCTYAHSSFSRKPLLPGKRSHYSYTGGTANASIVLRLLAYTPRRGDCDVRLSVHLANFVLDPDRIRLALAMVNT